MMGVVASLIKISTDWTMVQGIFVALCLLPLVVSMVFLAFAMFPRMNGPQGSNIFFGGIAKKTTAEYLDEMKNLSDEKYASDLAGQVRRNAEIAASKYSNVKHAFVASFISVPFWFISLYLLSA